jgi:hypothetical protein
VEKRKDNPKPIPGFSIIGLGPKSYFSTFFCGKLENRCSGKYREV